MVRATVAARARLKAQPVALTYLALGCGMQSSYLLAMSCLGLKHCPRADVAIFADTQCEPPWVYEQFEALKRFAGAHGVPVTKVTVGHLGRAALDRHQGTASRFANIPLWTEGKDGGEAPLRRQCTREYKIAPIQQEVRRVLGLGPRQRNRHHVRALIGISIEEVYRMKESVDAWVTNDYPLIDNRLRRSDCARGLAELGLPVPRKSSCVFCPHHTDDYWIDLKENFPALFEEACWYDEQLRDMTRSGLAHQAFVHRSLKPLREVDFRARVEADRKKRIPLFADLAGDCEGMCGQ